MKRWKDRDKDQKAPENARPPETDETINAAAPEAKEENAPDAQPRKEQNTDKPGEEKQAEQPKEAAPEKEAPIDLKPLLEASRQKTEEYLNLAQRVQADFDNYRRRNQNTRAEAFEDGAKEFIKTLLPVVDNLERALAAGSTDEAMHSGVELVYKQLRDILQKRGVTEISRKGEKFDPNLENAVMQGAPEDGEKGTVCQVLQKGYRLGDAVLRHAMVKVVPEEG